MASKIVPPNYTQVPNVLLDHMKHLSEAELRVMLLLCRQTFGWQRRECKASASFIAQGTGMSRQGVVNGVNRMVEKGLVGREPDGQSFKYWLVLELAQTPAQPVNDVDRSALEPVNDVDMHLSTTLTGQPSQPVNDVDTNKQREFKKTNKGARAPAAGEVNTSSSKRALTNGWVKMWEAQHGMAYKFEGAKDGRAADRLLALGLLPADILSVAQQAWEHPDWFNCKQAATLAGFECRFNDIRLELKNPPGSKSPTKAAAYRPRNGNY